MSFTFEIDDGDYIFIDGNNYIWEAYALGCKLNCHIAAVHLLSQAVRLLKPYEVNIAFDGSPAVGMDTVQLPATIRVRHSYRHSADDILIEWLNATTPQILSRSKRCFIVTNDKALFKRARDSGAIHIGTAAFTMWLHSIDIETALKQEETSRLIWEEFDRKKAKDALRQDEDRKRFPEEQAKENLRRDEERKREQAEETLRQRQESERKQAAEDLAREQEALKQRQELDGKVEYRKRWYEKPLTEVEASAWREYPDIKNMLKAHEEAKEEWNRREETLAMTRFRLWPRR